MKNEFKNKKVLLVGLGILGGGVTTANWLVKQGAKLSITDSKPREYFADSIKQIKGDVKYFFGTSDEKNIADADIIVLNQAIPRNNPLVMTAEKLGKPIYNESNIFYRECVKPIIAITGTRGKTTTTNWTAHLLGKSALVAGNSTEQALLKILPKTKSVACKVVVNEIPSFQLERFDGVPAIALITNIFTDHLARHGTMENYALAKANIFKQQTEKEELILNADNDWTDFFLKQKPKARVWFFSFSKLPAGKNGLFYENGLVYFTSSGKTEKIFDARDFAKTWGTHNIANLLSAMLAAHLAGESWANIVKRIKTLPQIKFREELTAKYKNISVVNDTTATSPEGGMAAIERFASPSCILISGGTDSDLDYTDWAKTIVKYLKPEQIVLIDGSATKKMLATLLGKMDTAKITVKDTLAGCVDAAFEKLKGTKESATILFSPAAKSFEKFKNEFDRGEQFNAIVKEKIKK